MEEVLATAAPPTWVAIDEAQNILPSERRTSATDVIVKYVREGRNYGLSFVVATQQPTAIDPRILAQVDTLLVHKLTVQGDIDYIRKNIKSNLPEEVKYGNSTLGFDETDPQPRRGTGTRVQHGDRPRLHHGCPAANQRAWRVLMAGRIRVLDSANRTMQRLGYLKALAALVNENETSNLETLGKRFISRVTQRVRLIAAFRRRPPGVCQDTPH